MPDTVTALLASPDLPPALAEHVTDHVEWPLLAGAAEIAVDEVDLEVRGAVALAGAYGFLDGLMSFGGAEMDEQNDRAVALLKQAEAYGVEDDLDELWLYSDRMREVAAEAEAMDEYVAEHGATPAQRLDAKLEEAHALYAAGDRAQALALFREVAEADVRGEYAGLVDRADIGWCRLLHDAAHVDGPDAARRVWQEARESRSGQFPWPGWSTRLVEVLLGTGLPDVLETLVVERMADAERPDQWPLDVEDRRVLTLALDEVQRHRG